MKGAPLRTHALLIGINTYPGFGAEAQLRGAVRDATEFADLLRQRWRARSEDLDLRLESEATRSAVLAGFETLIGRVGKGERAVVFFSGHGSQMTDREGDEGDGLDETLVTYDSGRNRDENRDVSDDEIHRFAARLLSKTPHVVLVFDCCHAATLHRHALRSKGLPADRRPAHLLPPSPMLPPRDFRADRMPIKLAACGDRQMAFELPADRLGGARGAFSFHLTEELRQAESGEGWRQLFGRVRERLRRDCPEQRAELSGEDLDAPLFATPARRRPARRAPSAEEELLRRSKRRLPGWQVDVYRSNRGPWFRLDRRGFRAGDRLRVDLRFEPGVGRSPRFVYLLDLGITGRLGRLFPEPGGHEALDPGLTLTVGDRPGSRLELYWPPDASPDIRAGDGHLLLVTSSSRLGGADLMGAHFEAGTSEILAMPYRQLRG